MGGKKAIVKMRAGIGMVKISKKEGRTAELMSHFNDKVLCRCGFVKFDSRACASLIFSFF